MRQAQLDRISACDYTAYRQAVGCILAAIIPYYKDSQYTPIDVDGEKFMLKPMNCPHHRNLHKSEPHSYRDLPLRLAEFGTVYRYEQSGELNGLTRVRGFTVDDSHLCNA